MKAKERKEIYDAFMEGMMIGAIAEAYDVDMLDVEKIIRSEIRKILLRH